MQTSRNVIRYLRDCYREDNRGGGVIDIFHDKVEFLRFFPEELLLREKVDRLPILEAEVRALTKAMALHRREKELLYGVLPVLGRSSAGPRGSTSVCAPLLLYPARIEPGDAWDEFSYLVPDRSAQRVNLRALSLLSGEEEEQGSRLSAFAESFPAPPFSELDWAEVFRRLGALLPGCDLSSLVPWPTAWDREAVAERAGTERRRRSFGAKCCLPAVMSMLVPRSRETGGVLFELGRLSEAPGFSRPLDALSFSDAVSPPLFEGPPSIIDEYVDEILPPEAPSSTEHHAPAVLSSAQMKALRSSREHPLTLVVGPPGTGKSYTLAALALDHLARGKSVLIASRGTQALDVVTEKIRELIRAEPVVVHAGRDGYRKDLRRFMKEVLAGARFSLSSTPKEARSAWKDVERLERDLAALEKRLVRRSRLEIEWGDTAERLRLGLRDRLRQRILRWYLRRRPDYWRKLQWYEQGLERRSKALAKALRTTLSARLVEVLNRHRQTLVRFDKALRSKTSSKQEELFSGTNLTAVLSALPLWTVTFAAVHRVLPLRRELFDLVIVDEATQCDLATCLPTLQRGSRAVITGDPKQLRHVSFLSRQQEADLAARAGVSPASLEDLSFREKSLLDRFLEVIPKQDQVAFLDEHFRSSPRIIEFSNRHFYGGNLRVMTENPARRRRGGLTGVFTDGRRDGSGTNPQEAERAVSLIEEIVESEASLPSRACRSLGVLSPFRKQVDLIAELLQERVSATALERHAILVGTPFSFQGEERDVMILSFVIDPKAPAGSFAYLSRPDVFNVSVTRARSLQYVLHSARPTDLPPGTLVRRYLESLEDRKPREDRGGLDAAVGPSLRSSPESDALLEEVCAELSRRGLETWPAFEVAGLVVDLIVEKDGYALGVDLIGHPGEFEEALDLERCRMLQRAGLDVHPLTLHAWRESSGRCVEVIEQRLERGAAALGPR